MKVIIRNITQEDRETLVNMMKEFYSSPAVFTNGSREIFSSSISACINKSPYLDGYVFEFDNKIVGYGMIAKSFSTEFGKPCYWIEDLYLLSDFRGKKIGTQFFDFVFNNYTDGIFRLEVEKENEKAIALYKKCGFSYLPYLEMKK